MAAFPVPHPGPGTQEVLSECLEDSEYLASLFCGLASIFHGNPSPIPLGPGASSPLSSACPGHLWPCCASHTCTVCVCPVSPRAQASSLPSDRALPSPWGDLPPSWPLWILILRTPGCRPKRPLCPSPPMPSKLLYCFFTCVVSTYFGLHLDQEIFLLPLMLSALGGTGFITFHWFYF